MTEEAFQEALRRDPKRERPWLMLVDGYEQQLGQIQAAIDRHGVEVTLVLDFIHVLEYLWKVAWCFFVPGCEAVEAWVGERALQILKGQGSRCGGGDAAHRDPAGPLPRPAQGGRHLRGLSPQYHEMLRYDRYLAEGFRIATGVIEGACRHLVKDCMDITGARWGLRSAEAVLNPVAAFQR